MKRQGGKLTLFLLGVSLAGILAIGCGPRVIRGSANIKQKFDQVTTGMTLDQVMNLFQPTGPKVLRMEQDGQAIFLWADKTGTYRAVLTMEGGKVVDKKWEVAEPPKEEAALGGAPQAGRCSPPRSQSLSNTSALRPDASLGSRNDPDSESGSLRRVAMNCIGTNNSFFRKGGLPAIPNRMGMLLWLLLGMSLLGLLTVGCGRRVITRGAEIKQQMRMKFLKWMVLLAMVLLPAWGLLAENLLPNGSFEAGRFGWYIYTRYSLGSRMEILETGAKFGGRCLRIERVSNVGGVDYSRGVWLVHEYFKLEAGKDHTFSVWLRSDSDSLPVILEMQCFDPVEIGKRHRGTQEVSVGKEWSRYQLVWKTPPAAMGLYQLRIEVKAPGTLYVDGAQIEPGPMSDFTPKAAVEMGLSPNREDSFYHLNDKLELAILAANSGGEDRRLNARITLTDYNDQKVAEKASPLAAPAGKTGEVTLDLTPGRLGYYRAEVELLEEKGEKIAQGRWAFGVIPEAREKPDVKFGICMEGGEDIEAQVALARKLGIGAVRLHNALLWGNTEKEKGKFTWDEEIPGIRAVDEAGMRPLVYLMTVPRWAIDPEKTKTNIGGWPKDLNDYAHAVKETVKTFKQWMNEWEIVNEPPAWYKPQEYFLLLKTAYGAAKEADPNCTVIGISGFVEDEKLMPYVLAQGGLEYMDVLSIHPYAIRLGGIPEKKVPQVWDTVRGLMRQYGGEEKPIWSTEFGWRATDWPPVPDFEGAGIDSIKGIDSTSRMMDEKTLADYLVRYHVISYARGVQRVYYFMLAIHLYGGTFTYDILVGDSLTSPKKAAVVLAGMTAMLSGRDFKEEWDVGSDNIWAVRFADDKNQVVVAWAPYGDDVLPLTGDVDSVQLYDIFGNKMPLDKKSGKARIGLGASPVYIETPLNAEIKPETILKVSPLEKIDVEEKAVAELTVTATNHFVDTLQGQLAVTVPKGWQAEPKAVVLDLKAGESRSVDFRITPAPNFTEPQARIRFELKRGGESLPIAAAERVPTFRLGPPPKPKHTIWIEAESATEMDPQFEVLKADCAYGGKFLYLDTMEAPPRPPGYLSVKIPFAVLNGGGYRLLFIGNPLNVAYMSPLWWRVDSGEWHRAWDLPQKGEVWTPWPDKGDHYKFFAITELGNVSLESGAHVLEVRIDEFRQIGPWYTLFADAFALVEVENGGKEVP